MPVLNMFKETTKKMKDFNFWKKLVKEQGAVILNTIIMNKIESMITEYMIRRPMEKAERLRRKNGYGPQDKKLVNEIYNALFGA